MFWKPRILFWVAHIQFTINFICEWFFIHQITNKSFIDKLFDSHTLQLNGRTESLIQHRIRYTTQYIQLFSEFFVFICLHYGWSQIVSGQTYLSNSNSKHFSIPYICFVNSQQRWVNLSSTQYYRNNSIHNEWIYYLYWLKIVEWLPKIWRVTDYFFPVHIWHKHNRVADRRRNYYLL